jgi:succinate dehydrogenase/fumarate reductase flavoprotein subunit
MDDSFHVALMTPVLHYTMGGLEIDAESRVLSGAHKPIQGLFAAGEVAGGVHGANRLGGSSLLGCVVFGRVSGDAAAAYLLQHTSALAGKAAERLGAVGGHLSGAPAPQTQGSQTATAAPSAEKKPEGKQPATAAASEEKKTSAGEAKAAPAAGKAYSLDDVAKHNTKDDCWVIVNGQVLDVTSFLPDHPGGEKAILLYAGRDATEEFNMLHDPKVIGRYAPDSVIGSFKE